MKRARSTGGGRKKSTVSGGVSRQKFACPICGKSYRTDKLKEHYFGKVIWDKNGNPVPSYSDAYRLSTKEKQEHTEYFRKHTLSKNKLPTNQTISHAPKNPFDACKHRHDPD